MWWRLHSILAQATEAPTATEPGEALPLTGIMWVVGIGLIAFFMLRVTRRRLLHSQQRGQRSVQERVAEAREASDVTDRINELMAELAELARQLNGELDTRTTKLEVLLAQADRTIERLEQVQAAARKSPPAQQDNHRSAPADAEAKPMAAAEIDDDPDEAVTLTSPGSEEILALAAEGVAAPEIARRLDRGVGEVELILSLGRRCKG